MRTMESQIKKSDIIYWTHIHRKCFFQNFSMLCAEIDEMVNTCTTRIRLISLLCKFDKQICLASVCHHVIVQVHVEKIDNRKFHAVSFFQ